MKYGMNLPRDILENLDEQILFGGEKFVNRLFADSQLVGQRFNRKRADTIAHDKVESLFKDMGFGSGHGCCHWKRLSYLPFPI